MNESNEFPVEVKNFIDSLLTVMRRQVEAPIIGVYLHGSLAMGPGAISTCWL